MSQHHQLIKNDARWKQARLDCFERDGYACVRCGSADQLEADHVIRLEDRPDLALDVNNLQTLCNPCHVEKTREDLRNKLIRVTWLNPSYAELQEIIDGGSVEPVELGPGAIL